ncbi:MAG: 3-oxoacyl-(acyl-carrier-protein) reductase, partial [Planctomycetaceae bacterium]|nr:3-oxoacyl-(acyl-carrier-protein) reductase [Planctomycetaceae bacterium]
MSAKIFEGRTAVVTGGARGIGKAISVMLAREGARVAINYERNANAARDTLKLIEAAGGQGMIVQADVASESDVDRMMAQVREELGPIE